MQIGWWGNMGGPPQKGIITYGTCSLNAFALRLSPFGSAISPYRYQPMKGFVRDGLFHGTRRILKLAPYILPTALISWYTLHWGIETNEYYNSKAG